MKKLLLILTLALLLGVSCYFFAKPTKTFAVETSESSEIFDSSTEQSIDSSIEHSSVEQSAEISAVVPSNSETKAPLEDADDYFINNILPLITGIGSALLALLGFLIPFFKNHARYKQLQGLYTQLVDDKNNLDTLLKSTDLTQIKAVLMELFATQFNEQLTSAVSKLRIDKESIAELQANLDVVNARLDALLKGASVAWQGKPEAVSALVDAPTKKVLQDLTEANNRLKSYILEKYGDDATKIIKEIEGV